MTSPPRGPVLLGAAATVLMVAASWWAGAVPARFRGGDVPVIRLFRVDGGPALALATAGLVALLVAWLWLGRHLVDGMALRPVVWAWSLPWLVALPWGTRDPWAYAARGDLSFHGLDPYRTDPVTSAAFGPDVSANWRHAASPYGPLWEQFARLVRAVCGEHGVTTVLVHRLPVLAAVLVSVPLLTRLADRLGVPAGRAVWLAVLNPVTLVLGLGGAHNDLVMVAFLLAGTLAAVSVRTGWTGLVLAGGWCALGAAVKAPAVIALAFAVAVWAVYAVRRPSARRIATGCVVAGASFLVVFGVITLASGWGLGWARQLGAQATVVNWTSLPTAVVLTYRVLTGDPHTRAVTDALRQLRTAGAVLSALVLLGCWLRGLRRQPMAWAALGFLAVIFLGAAVQPWYLCWVLPYLALSRLPRWATVVLAGICVGWTLFIQPDGDSYVMRPVAIALLAAGLAAAWWALRPAQTGRLTTTPSTPGPV